MEWENLVDVVTISKFKSKEIEICLNKLLKILTISYTKTLALTANWITQTISWILFLRYHDELELEKKDEAELELILDEEFRWGNWAVQRM